MDLKRDIKDMSQFREFLLNNGLKPADVAIVARNKRIKALINEKFKIFQENETLKQKLRNKENELFKLEKLFQANNIQKIRFSTGGRRGKTAKQAPKTIDEVVAEIYPNGVFRRYIVGDRMIQKMVKISLEEAKRLIETKQPLPDGNFLVKGEVIPRTCSKCSVEGKIGEDFKIQTTFVDSMCIPCKTDYMRNYRAEYRKNARGL